MTLWFGWACTLNNGKVKAHPHFTIMRRRSKGCTCFYIFFIKKFKVVHILFLHLAFGACFWSNYTLWTYFNLGLFKARLDPCPSHIYSTLQLFIIYARYPNRHIARSTQIVAHLIIKDVISLARQQLLARSKVVKHGINNHHYYNFHSGNQTIWTSCWPVHSSSMLKLRSKVGKHGIQQPPLQLSLRKSNNMRIQLTSSVSVIVKVNLNQVTLYSIQCFWNNIYPEFLISLTLDRQTAKKHWPCSYYCNNLVSRTVGWVCLCVTNT
jgi:hypothetical protein